MHHGFSALARCRPRKHTHLDLVPMVGEACLRSQFASHLHEPVMFCVLPCTSLWRWPRSVRGFARVGSLLRGFRWQHHGTRMVTWKPSPLDVASIGGTLILYSKYASPVCHSRLSGSVHVQNMADNFPHSFLLHGHGQAAHTTTTTTQH